MSKYGKASFALLIASFNKTNKILLCSHAITLCPKAKRINVSDKKPAVPSKIVKGLSVLPTAFFNNYS